MKFFLACGLIRSNNKEFNFRAMFVFLLTLFLLAACSSHPKGPPGEGVLKTNELIPLLVDLHYYEAVYTSTGFGSRYTHGAHTEITDYYISILESYGIDREKFKKTLDYYSYNPRQFEAIYDRVIDKLNKRLSEIDMEMFGDMGHEPEEREIAEIEPVDLWNIKENWVFPGEDENQKISFDIPVRGLGMYNFSAQIRLSPDDYSEDARVSIWFWYDDGTESGYREYFDPVEITKSGQLIPVTMSRELTNTEVTRIRGHVLDLSNPDENKERSANVKDIRLEFIEYSGSGSP